MEGKQIDFSVKYAPNTILVVDNQIKYLNILGRDENMYIAFKSIDEVQNKVANICGCCKELIMSKLN